MKKAGFKPRYYFILILLDCLKIIQIYWFIEYKKASCLNLKFIFSNIINKVYNI